jgi:DNA uptake protein ComE-like DNA-binding protein
MWPHRKTRAASECDHRFNEGQAESLAPRTARQHTEKHESIHAYMLKKIKASLIIFTEKDVSMDSSNDEITIAVNINQSSVASSLNIRQHRVLLS